MKYLFYPGCNAEQVEKEALNATVLVCSELGIELQYAKDFSCCGATHLDKVDGFLELLVNARNMARAEEKELPILTICNTCYIVMKRVQNKLERNSELKERVNYELAKVGLKYKGTVRVLHLLDALYDDYGIDQLRGRVIREFTGIKIAPFYGCHILRPESELERSETETEQMVDDIIQATGAELVNYDEESSCCGFHVTMANPDLCAKLNGRNLLSAKEAEVDMIVTPCTLCHTVMDGQQHRAEKEIGQKLRIPVMHLPQLVGLAIGIDAKRLGLGRHIVSCKELLTKIENGAVEDLPVDDENVSQENYDQPIEEAYEEPKVPVPQETQSEQELLEEIPPPETIERSEGQK